MNDVGLCVLPLYYLSVTLCGKPELKNWNPRSQKNVGALVSQIQLWAVWCCYGARCCLNCTSSQLGKRKIFLIWKDSICVVFVPKAVRLQALSEFPLVPIIDSVAFAPSLVLQWSSCGMWFNRQESTRGVVWQKKDSIMSWCCQRRLVESLSVQMCTLISHTSARRKQPVPCWRDSADPLVRQYRPCRTGAWAVLHTSSPCLRIWRARHHLRPA